MDYLYGLAQTIGVHTIIGLSAYVVLQTGQVTMAQAAFYAVGAYVSAMLTTLWGLNILIAIPVAALVAMVLAGLAGFPALRFKGLMLVVATMALGEAVREFFFNFDYQIAKGDLKVGPAGAEGFRQIRYFYERGWTTAEVAAFIWMFVIGIMALLWWMDRSRIGAVLRAVGEDELAAQSVGINLTAVKVSAFAIGGAIAGVGGALYAHYTTHVEHTAFGVLMATFAIAYPILGGLSSVFGTLIAVVFIQGLLIQWLPILIGGELRNLLFGLLILLAMNLRPRGLIDPRVARTLRGLFVRSPNA
ncbi:MAG: branched-chain amino acid ABC transporter permease [Candidatus Odyssella sp.]|nr:branched-chain amino acid ABC transporter permease [Candidatus Odyssella sp.]